MKYIVERDLFMSKIENFINDKFEKGYRLHSMVVTETEEKPTDPKFPDSKPKISIARKVTLVFKEIDN